MWKFLNTLADTETFWDYVTDENKVGIGGCSIDKSLM